MVGAEAREVRSQRSALKEQDQEIVIRACPLCLLCSLTSFVSLASLASVVSLAS
jgi:hypothetical protein